MSSVAPLPVEPLERDPFPPKRPPGQDELPYSDGMPMESEKHAKQQNLLTSSLDRALRDRDDVYVGGNMFVYFSELQTKKNDFRGPDVFVVLGTTRRERKSWVAWEEGGRLPNVVIELLSPSTEENDRGEKMRVYAKVLHVSNYYLFDPLTGALEGYELDSNTLVYRRLPPSPAGDVPCPFLGLQLGVRHGRYHGLESDWLRWLDAEARVLPTADEDAEEAERRAAAATTQREDAERRAAAATTQREDAERRLAEALAEIERLKRGAVPK